MKAYLRDEPCQVTLMFCYTTAKPDEDDEMTEPQNYEAEAFFSAILFTHRNIQQGQKKRARMQSSQTRQPCPDLQSPLAPCH